MPFNAVERPCTFIFFKTRHSDTTLKMVWTDLPGQQCIPHQDVLGRSWGANAVHQIVCAGTPVHRGKPAWSYWIPGLQYLHASFLSSWLVTTPINRTLTRKSPPTLTRTLPHNGPSWIWLALFTLLQWIPCIRFDDDNDFYRDFTANTCASSKCMSTSQKVGLVEVNGLTSSSTWIRYFEG